MGKTTLAKRLVRQYRGTLIDIDASTEAVVRAGLSAAGMDCNDRDSPAFKTLFRDAIHDSLFAACRAQLECCTGTPCVIVAPFTKERRLPNFLEWVTSRLPCATEAFICVLQCPEELRVARIHARGNPRDKSKFRIDDPTSFTAEYASTVQPETLERGPRVVIVDASHPSPPLDGPWASLLCGLP